jgi:hypothetical protein
MVPVPSKQIETMKELEMSGLQIIALSRYVNYIRRTAENDRIVQMITYVSVEGFYQKLSANDLTVAYAHKRHSIDHWIHRRQHVIDGVPIFHVMKECPLPHLDVYIATYGSPYLGRINELLQRVTEMGLRSYWRSQPRDRVKIVGKIDNLGKQSNSLTQLSMVHLRMVFYIFISGCLCSIFVFVCEVGYFKCIAKNKNQ